MITSKTICHNWMFNRENWEYEVFCPVCRHTTFLPAELEKSCLKIGTTINCSCGTSLILGEKNIWAIVDNYKISSLLQSRFVGNAPTHEWTGLALQSLLDELREINYPFSTFLSDVKGQPLYGKKCVCFTTFGNPE